MKVVLDACVLYPPHLRGILVGLAEVGLYRACWSERILEEWARAVRKLGPEAEAEARVAGAMLRAQMPGAILGAAPGVEGRLVLPDENDRHVLAVAIAGSADAILTYNASDFPQHVLAAEGVVRRDPDGFLWELWSADSGRVEAVLERVRAGAEARLGQAVGLKGMLKRLRLNRLAKAVAGAG